MLYYMASVPVFPEITEAYKITRSSEWRDANADNLFIIVTDGSCIINYDGSRYTLLPGDVALIPGDGQYSRSASGNSCTMIYFHYKLSPHLTSIEEEYAISAMKERADSFDKAIISSKLTDIGVNKELYLAFKCSLGKSGIEFAENTLSELKKCELYSLTLASLRLSSLLVMSANAAFGELRLGNERIEPEFTSSKLRNAVQYIQEHHTQHISLAEICEHIFISPQHLIRLFKRELGMTPLEYINTYKISRAHFLIRKNPHLAVQQVSEELGFETPHYFTRLFTKITGESPTAYRERMLFVEKRTPPKNP